MELDIISQDNEEPIDGCCLLITLTLPGLVKCLEEVDLAPLSCEEVSLHDSIRRLGVNHIVVGDELSHSLGEASELLRHLSDLFDHPIDGFFGFISRVRSAEKPVF